MEYVTLNNGVLMPVLGLGTWDLRGRQCVECLLSALECGYRLIDTARMYGNEEEVGKALVLSGVSRQEIFVTSKICAPDNSYAGAKKAVENSLERLGLDYLDLMLIHEPYREAGEMYKALEEAYNQGVIKAIGVSNFNPDFYFNFMKGCRIIPAVNQVEAHVFYQRSEFKNRLLQSGTVMEAWSPFAAGKKDIFHNDILRTVGSKYGKSAAQIALKFLVQNGIPAIPKSSSAKRIKENIDVFDFQLDAEDMEKIRVLDGGQSLFGWY